MHHVHPTETVEKRRKQVSEGAWVGAYRDLPRLVQAIVLLECGGVEPDAESVWGLDDEGALHAVRVEPEAMIGS